MISKARSSPVFGSSAATAWMRELGQRASMQVLADALVDARVAPLDVEHGAHDIDVELLRRVLGAGDDVVGDLEDELGELGLVKAGFAKVLQILRIDRRVGDEPARQARQRRLAGSIGVVGLLERMHEAAQVVVGVVGDVRRHLRVAEIGGAAAVRIGAQRPQKVRLAGARLAVEQQDAVLRAGSAPGNDASEKVGEFAPRLGVHLGDVDGIGPPNIVLPGDRLLERREEPVRSGLRLSFLLLHQSMGLDVSVFDAHVVPDGVLVEDRGILEFLDVLFVLEVGARKHQLARPMSAGQHVLEVDLRETPFGVRGANRVPHPRDKRLAGPWPSLGARACRAKHTGGK